MSGSSVVVVTGASAGLGRAVAHAYAKRGAKLGLLARNPEALAAAKRECDWLGGHAMFVPTDVSDAEAVERAATQIEAESGPIDIWVNDAMVSVFSPVKEMEAADYKRVTDVLYLGFVHGTLSALRRMLPRDKGTIVQIGSALSYRSIPLQSAYCACKHAINGFTDSLRCELHHDRSRVHITTVQMPAMNTTQFDWVKNRMPDNTQPVPPIFEPELTAEVVVAAGLAKQPRREYWVGSSKWRPSSVRSSSRGCWISIWAILRTRRSRFKTNRAIQTRPTISTDMFPEFIGLEANSGTGRRERVPKFCSRSIRVGSHLPAWLSPAWELHWLAGGEPNDRRFD